MTTYTEQLNTLIDQYRTASTYDAEVISDLETSLETIRSKYALTVNADRPVVTIPVIFRRAYDENFISDYLAHILNPIHSGLGYSALQSLLTFGGVSCNLDSNDAVGLQVFREYQLSEESRIDILIVIKRAKVIISIENKIFSSEGFKQTLRYSQAIRESFPAYTHVLFFLTPSGAPASSSEFKSLSYAELLIALRSFQPINVSERDRFIYQDFLLHVENYIMKSVNLKLSQKSLLYLNNAEMITDLQEAFSQDASSIFQVVAEIIKGFFAGVSEDWEYSFSDGRGYQQVWKKHWKTNQLWVHYEFWFSRDSLFTDPEISFMIDAEGKQKDSFLQKFDQLQGKLKGKYQSAAIQYRPKSRGLALAFKNYKFQLSPDNLDRSAIESFFQKIINEMLFLVEPIDQSFDKSKSK